MNDITLDSCDEISLEVLNKYIIVKYEISTHTYTQIHSVNTITTRIYAR